VNDRANDEALLGHDDPRLTPRVLSAALSAIGAAALIALPAFANASIIVSTIDTMTLALFVLSLNLLVGYAGMISMGHAAFFATGGYVAGLLSKYFGLSLLLAMPAGVLAAALLALVVGFFSIRVTHAYFIMLTLAFGQLVYTVFWKWSSVTGGDDGLIGFGPPEILGGNVAYYYFTLLVVGICTFGLYRVCRSPFGRMLTAIRDNPDRTTSIGVNVHAVKLSAFVIAGLFAGVAGALEAFFHRGMFVNSAHVISSADALVILLLGGRRWFAGPIAGAVLYKALFVTIPLFTVYWLFYLGLVILAVALFMPEGVAALGHMLKRKSASGTQRA
jgi:branched-chain amino acid transport system permease protein